MEVTFLPVLALVLSLENVTTENLQFKDTGLAPRFLGAWVVVAGPMDRLFCNAET